MKKLIGLFLLLPLFASAQPLLRNTATTNQSPFNANQFNDASGTTITIKNGVNITNLNGRGGWNLLSGSLSFSANPSYTANTILWIDNNQLAGSLANGTGALTNNGSGTFGWYNSYGTLPAFQNWTGSNFFNFLVVGSTGITNQGLSASTVTATDANKKEVSLANGGANTFLEGTTPPAFRALTQADIPVIVTNANNSVSIIPFQWGVLVTNNNCVLNNTILAGGTLSASGINWAVLFMTNSSASTKTLLIPASVAVTGTALGSTTTAYCTNAGILTVWAIANTITGAVWRSYP